MLVTCVHIHNDRSSTAYCRSGSQSAVLGVLGMLYVGARKTPLSSYGITLCLSVYLRARVILRQLCR